MDKTTITVLYQGDCTFCRWCVNLVIKNSNEGVFVFIVIDSDEGKNLVAIHTLQIDVNHPDSIAVLEEGKSPLYKWRAGVRIAKSTRFPFKLVYYATVLIPDFIGNALYGWVGRHRNFLCWVTQCGKK